MFVPGGLMVSLEALLMRFTGVRPLTGLNAGWYGYTNDLKGDAVRIAVMRNGSELEYEDLVTIMKSKDPHF